jgi:hypothetical protein
VVNQQCTSRPSAHRPRVRQRTDSPRRARNRFPTSANPELLSTADYADGTDGGTVFHLVGTVRCAVALEQWHLDAGGVTEFSRWRQPPDMNGKCGSPGRGDGIAPRDFRRPAGLALLVVAVDRCPSGTHRDQTATVTRKKVAGMEVASLLLFWLLNSSSNSFCRSAARPLFSAASNAFMVGP